MRRFLTNILYIVGIPLLILFCVFLFDDPFTTLHPFDINNVDETNREYATVELFLRNNPNHNYNAFIFCSSQGTGLNSYVWKQYLSEDARPFFFQVYGGNITGVQQKVDYLDKIGSSIDYAIILMDMPDFFSNAQLSHSAVNMKHYIMEGEPEWVYHAYEFYNFLQRPSYWIKFTKTKLNDYGHRPYSFDTVTNDFYLDNKYTWNELPPQDSLCNCSEQTRRNFFYLHSIVSDDDLKVAEPKISGMLEEKMNHIAAVFKKHNTDYIVIISPTYCYTHPSLNPEDLLKIEKAFGKNNVYDYTGKNKYTMDYNNFSDPNHFGRRVGYFMLEEIYSQRHKE